MKYLFLFDLDNTLFDSASYRKKLFQNIEEVCESSSVSIASDILQDNYNQQIKQFGVFDPELFVESVFGKNEKKLGQKIKDLIFNSLLLRDHLHTDVFSTFKTLSKLGEIGIFSQGEEKLQNAKITHFLELISKDKVHIERDKKSELQKVFQKYNEYTVYFIDDMLPILRAAKMVSPEVISIWIKRGRYAEVQKDIEGFTPDFTALNLDEAVNYIKTTIKN